MSIEAAQVMADGTSPQAAAIAPRSIGRQAVIDTLARPGARLGLAWLGVLAFCTIFGPLIANTHPILMKSGGAWSSPMLRNLTPADVLLMLASAMAIVLSIGRWFSFGLGLLITIATPIVLAPPALFFVRPPANVDYTLYRTMLAEGKIESAVYTIVPYSPSDRLRDRTDARLSPPNRAHWFGTDNDGADVFSNILHASRVALSIGFVATGISVTLGILIGGIMGYFGGVFDLLSMRTIEIVEALPRLVLLITISALAQHRNIYLMMAIIGLTGYTSYARFVRAEFLTLRQRDFVQAAIAAGYPQYRIIFRQMLPNALTPVLVSTTFGVASAILYEATLSFLGLGLVDEPSWGALLEQARAAGAGFIWWIALFPGIAIFLTVFSYNLIGEAARDALDPKLRKRE
ncbi:MAG TPA: ABC transporter permease [Tepidisphaeraceae bacterium]|jgi:peptide/nickel transport system permease protein